jgi:hypothetical protein
MPSAMMAGIDLSYGIFFPTLGYLKRNSLEIMINHAFAFQIWPRTPRRRPKRPSPPQPTPATTPNRREITTQTQHR